MEMIKKINLLITILFFCCYIYQLIYLIVPFVKKEKKIKKVKKNKYAVLISARNEEKVIANLIETIKNQDYPQKLIKIFVVADNCTDKTAEIAKEAGANVYERFDKVKVGKGYALDYLLKKIISKYGEKTFDGYFVFDADNLLKYNYITEMNKVFSNDYEILTSYRNSKNYGDNWISAGYALWFLRESKYLNESRMLNGTSCAISGTGFLFSKKILQKYEGWKFFLLTEDIEFTVANILDNVKIGYCKNAILYDEQPVKFKQSWNQRLRWSKGYFQVAKNYGFKLLKKAFYELDFSAFDMSMVILPTIVINFFAITFNLGTLLYYLLIGKNILPIIAFCFIAFMNSYLLMYFLGLLTTITEWKQIYTSWYKKIKYTFTFPLFLMTYIPISIVALFKKVEWKPIEHTKVKKIKDIEIS